MLVDQEIKLSLAIYIGVITSILLLKSVKTLTFWLKQNQVSNIKNIL